MKTYYAIQHTYGATTCDMQGSHIGKLAVFSSRKDRDAWVSDGNPYSSQPGARTAATLRDATDRRFIRGELAEGNPYAIEDYTSLSYLDELEQIANIDTPVNTYTG